MAENRPLTSVRGFAALWVVGHHWFSQIGLDFQAFRLGYRAVDIFFILSGFIISSIYQDIQAKGVFLFWAKRACRLYPVHLTLFIFVCLFATYPSWNRATLAPLVDWNLAASAFLLQPYLTVKIANPVAWSAGVELLCYLLFPAAIVLVRRMPPRHAAVLALVALLAGEHAVLQTYGGNVGGFGAVYRALGGFGIGMLTWRVSCGIRLTAWGATALEVMGLGGLLACVAANRSDLLPLWFAPLLLGLFCERGVMARALAADWCVWLGRISFSIYLMHYPLIAAADRWFPMTKRPGGAMMAETARMSGLLALLLVLSTLSYRFIESPGRRIPNMLGTATRRLRARATNLDATTSTARRASPDDRGRTVIGSRPG